MLRYYDVHHYEKGPYEEDDSSEEDKSSDEDESSDEDDEWDEDNDYHVCLCDPTDFNAETCCCNHLDLRCNGKCRPDGYDRWLKARWAAF